MNLTRTVKRLLLIDEDREREAEFPRFYDRENRAFIRIGIAMSTVGWLTALLYVGLVIRSFFVESALLIGFILLPLFVFMIASTYSDQWV